VNLSAICAGTWRGAGMTLVNVGDRIVLTQIYEDRDGDEEYEPYGKNYDIDGSQRLDLQVFYNGLKDWKLSLQVRNVTDETYIERTNSAYLYGHFFGSPRA